MKSLLAILFLVVCIITARYILNKKIENLFIVLLALSLCLRIDLFSVGGSVVHLNRYQTDYFNFWMLDFVSLCLGLKGVRYYFKKKQREKYILPCLYCLLNFLSILVSTNKMAAITTAARAVELMFLFYYFAVVFDTSKQGKYLIYGLCMGIWFEGLLALYQKITNNVLGLDFLGESLSAFRTHEIVGEQSSGVSGTLGHSSELALFAIFVLAFVIISENLFKNKMLYYMTLVITLLVVYLSDSRTALFLSVISILLYICINTRLNGYDVRINKTALFMLLSGCFAASVILVVDNHIMNMFHSESLFNSWNIRYSQWSAALVDIKSNPLLGHGANNYVDYMYTYRFKAYNSIWNYQNPVHNTYLLFWFDLGIGGLIVATIMQIKYTVYALRKKNSIQKSAGLFIFISAIYWFTGWAFMKRPMIFMLWVAYGIANNNRLNTENDNE